MVRLACTSLVVYTYIKGHSCLLRVTHKQQRIIRERKMRSLALIAVVLLSLCYAAFGKLRNCLLSDYLHNLLV